MRGVNCAPASANWRSSSRRAISNASPKSNGSYTPARFEYSKASAPDASNAGASRVMLLDTMGDLRAMYGRGAAAFVGGSLRPGRGGQSLAEPAAAGVPVLFGPFPRESTRDRRGAD